ncbi:hypothetical protein H8S90_13165 [Olivibacter sp. SDN3]|uniref:hypothetical protein n=1 Tax=Olivibacter sp. SDN3 TaxID=2764720 RepID=UPI00165117C8|nr:hypothetical protein [Olivibacter sp. SDN3]QNL47771.1 hypothetical protein H8S90_13165 [Olivibacter sp. SDN3]
MSLPSARVRKIRTVTKSSLDVEMESNRKKVIENRTQLQEVEEKLFSVEEKWIKNEIDRDTYDRWYNDSILNLKGAIEKLSNDQSQAFSILEKNLNLLTDMRHVYSKSNTLQKREFVNMVFDSNLHYESGIYRIPTMLGILSHNHLKMKEKGLLIYEKKEGPLDEDPLSGESGITFALLGDP